MTTELPPFSAIKAEHVTPAISELIAQGRAQLAQLLADLPSPSWDTLVAPLEEQGDKLDQAWAPISHLNSVANSDALRKAYTESVALLTDYSTEFSQNEALYKAYQQLADSDEFAQLTQAQRQTINNALRDFRLGGVALNEADKKLYAMWMRA